VDAILVFKPVLWEAVRDFSCGKRLVVRQYVEKPGVYFVDEWRLSNGEVNTTAGTLSGSAVTPEELMLWVARLEAESA
jgi:hypothetical protein